MATPSTDNLIRSMETQAEARREEANQHRLEIATKAEARREEANQHRLEMATEAEARREEANQHRLGMATKAEVRREEANQHRLEMAEMEQQRVVELRALGDMMATIRPRDRARDTPRLQRMMEGEGVESFLTTFERVM